MCDGKDKLRASLDVGLNRGEGTNLICRDTNHNDPRLQGIRAEKLCEYMNKVEEKLLDISITEQV